MQGFLRSVTLTGAAKLLESLGANPAALAASVGLPESALFEPDLPVRGEDVVRFFSMAAAETGCRNFGLLLADYQGLSVLGPVWVLMNNARTIREAMEMLASYLILHTPRPSIYVATDDGGMTMTYDLGQARNLDDVQAVELGLAICVQYIRSYCEPGWNPVAVQFRHAAPQNRAHHQQMFGASLAFDQDRNAIVLDRTTLSRPVSRDDGRSRKILTSYLRAEKAYVDDIWVVRTESIVRALLPYSESSLATVANALNTSARTLQRRLLDEHTSFEAIRERVRIKIALKYIQQSNLTIAEISEILGYSQTSAFSRAFRRIHGASPKECRKRVK